MTSPVGLVVVTAITFLIAVDAATAQSRVEKACFEDTEPAPVISACTRIIRNKRADPSDRVLAYINRGDAYRSQKRDKDAMDDYMAAQDLAADHGVMEGRRLAAQSAAEMAFDQAEYLKAMVLFGRAYDDRRSEPEHIATMRYYAGLSAMRIKQNDLALEEFDEVIKLRPKWAEAYRERGLAHLGKKNFDKSASDLNQAIGLKPADSKAYFIRAMAHKGQGNLAQARQDLAKVLEIEPSNQDARDELQKMGNAN